MDIKNRNGAVLPLVLVISVAIIIVCLLYSASQIIFIKTSYKKPIELQALCNARSGIWKSFELIAKPSSTIDSMFNKNLFTIPKDTFMDTIISGNLDDVPFNLELYSCDSFGDAEVCFSYLPCFRIISSKGRFKDLTKSVTAFLAGKLYSSSDTNCYLLNGTLPVGNGIIEGKVAILQDTVSKKESSNIKKQKEKTNITNIYIPQINLDQISKVVYYYKSRLKCAVDTLLPSLPVLIKKNDQIEKVPDAINGALFVYDPLGDVNWNQKRRIYLTGDVQISGKAKLKNIEFVSGGEFRCFDDVVLDNVSVFCEKRFLLGDRVVFKGNVVCLSSCLIYKKARVENKSIIVTYGENISKDKTGEKIARPRLPISVFISQEAFIDGIVIATGNGAGIKTDNSTTIKGVLWTDGLICHQGELMGILHAKQLIEFSVLMNMVRQGPNKPQNFPNYLTGSIKKIDNIEQYYGPFYLGKPFINQWIED
jgi:hypothetical protein